MEKREGYAPWSLTRKAGVQSATVNGDIDVPQFIQPVLDTGFVDERGNWKGTKSSDEVFIAFDTHVGIPNTGEMLTPQAVNDRTWPIDMTGFKDIILAIKTTSAGSYQIGAVMGPDSNSFANLSPVDSAQLLYGNTGQSAPQDLTNLFYENGQTLSANKWNIYIIQKNLANQKLLQFQVINNSGSEANVEFAFMRIV